TVADANGTGNLTFTVADNGGTSNGGVDTLTQNLSITVNAVNESPVRTAGSLSFTAVDEDSANTTAVSLGLSAVAYGPGGGSDESGQTLIYTITAIPSFVTLYKSDGTTQINVNGTVTASELQGLTYKTVANANGTGNLTWTVADSGSGTSPNVNTLTENLSLTVNAVNDAPTLVGTVAAGGTEFHVNTVDTGLQSEPSIGRLANGGYVMTWLNMSSGVWKTDVQIFDSSFNKVGSEFEVGDANYKQSKSVVAGLTGGRFVVAWRSDQNDSQIEVNARVFEANGTPVGNEFRVNTTTTATQSNPSIAALSNGGFAIAWESAANYNTDGRGWDDYVQRYDAGGTAVGSETLLNATLTGDQNTPQLAALPSGGFVSTWLQRETNGTYTIHGRVFDANAQPGNEFTLDTSGTTVDDNAIPRHPAIGVFSNGNFIVAWENLYREYIYAQRFDASGTAQGSRYQLGPTTGQPGAWPAVTVLADDSFIIGGASTTTNGDFDMFGWSFDASANLQQSKFTLNSYQTSTQDNIALAATSTGFLAAWTSYEQEGTGKDYGVYARPFTFDAVVNLTAINEDSPTAGNNGTSVADVINGLTINDPDASPSKGIAIYSVDTSHGSWEYKIGTGSWTSLSSVTANAALLLNNDAGSYVRFLPNADWNGTATFGFRAWDQTVHGVNAAGTTADITANGGSSEFSSNTGTASITVSSVNDIPVRAAGTLTSINVAEDSANTAAVSLGLSGLTYGPGGGSDETSQTLTYTVTAIPSFITLYKSDGTTQVTVNTTLTLSELQDLKYKTVADANGTGNLTWTVADSGSGTSPNVNTLTENLSLTVSAVNDAPTDIALSTGSVSSFDSGNATVGTLTATDPDNTTWTYSIVSVTSPSGAVTNTNGAVFDLGTTGSSSTAGAVASATLRAVSPSSLAVGTYTVRIQADDGGTGSTYQKDLTVTVDSSLVINVTAIGSDALGTYAEESTDDSGLDLKEALYFANSASGNVTITFKDTLSGTITLPAGLTVRDGITFKMDSDTDNRSLTITANNLTLGGALTVDVATGDTLTINSNLADNGTATSSLSKTGSGTLTLSGTNTYTGATTVSAGGLTTGGAAVIADGSAVTVASGATLTLGGNETIDALSGAGNVVLGSNTLTANGNTSNTFSGVISGTNGNFVKAGTGRLTLSGSNTYTGTTTVQGGGTLSIAGSGNLGSGALTVNAGTLEITGATSLSHNITLTGTATFSHNTAVTLSGVLSGAGGLTKTGSGTLSLSGANTYSGATAVSVGSLLLTSTGALSATSGVTVASGATLGGSGSIFATSSSNTLTVASGATLSPGIAGTNSGAGTLTVNGNLSLSGTLAANINGATVGTQYDQVVANGTVNLNAPTLSTTLNYTPVLNDTFKLIDNDGSDDAITGTFSGLAEGGRTGSLQASYKTTVNGSGNDFTLTMNNTPPTAANGSVSSNEDTAYTFTAANFSFSDADTDASVNTFTQVQITALPSVGSLKLNGTAVTTNQEILVSDISAGKLTFTPLSDAAGTPYATFQFKVHDGAEYSASAYTETLNVNSVNDGASISGTATGQVTEDGTTTVGATLNVYDVDDSGFQGQSNVAGTYGTFTLASGGSWSYTLNNSAAAVQALAASDSKTDTFAAVSSDGTASQAITVTVKGANDAPLAVADTTTALEAGGNNNGTAGSNPTGNVLSNDTDVDTGDSKTVSAISGGTVGTAKAGTYGSLTLNADGSYSYAVDNANAAVQALKSLSDTLTDTFTYTVQDAGGLTGTASLTVTIQGANDAPVAVADAATAVEAGGVNNATAGSNASGNVLSNDTDVDAGDSKIVSAVAGGSVGSAKAGSYGSLTLNSDGSYSYTVDNANAAVQALKGGDTLTDTFTYTVRDGGSLTSTATLTITIQGANDAPAALADTATAVEAGGSNNATAGSNPTGNVLSNDTDVDSGDTKTVSALTGGSVGTAQAGSYGSLTLNSDGSYSYTVDNANTAVQALKGSGNTLTDTFTYTVQDGGGLSSSTTLTITIQGSNDAPAATADSYGTTEDKLLTVTAAQGVLANDSDPESDGLQAVLVQGPSHGTLTLNGNGSFSYQPEAGYNGTDSFTYQANDGTLDGNAVTVALTVTAVNDAPSFNGDGNQTVDEDAGAQTVANWATAIKAGPADETSQTVSFSVSNDNNALFSVQPSLDANGQLTYTPAANANANANANGTATITVIAKDSGGTANGGIDQSAAQTFTITVKPVNDAPSFTAGGNQTVDEDAGAQTVANWATALKAGPSDESTQTLSFSVSNDNAALFSVQPSIDANGQLSYTPAANANGTATVTVLVKDDGGTANGGVDQSAAQTFTITVKPVNDAPSFTAGGNQTVDEDAGAQMVAWATAIKAGPSDESTQTLSFQVSNDNAALFSVQPSIDANGQLTYTPAANANGTATITVIAKDSGGTANGGVDQSAAQTFTLTVKPLNDAPVITSGATGSVVENLPAGTVVYTATATDVDAGQTLNYSLSGADAGLFGIGAKTGAVTFKTSADFEKQSSYSLIVTATDDGPGRLSASQTVTLSVDDVSETGNQAPRITSGATAEVKENLPAGTVVYTVTAGDTDAGQTLTYSLSGKNADQFDIDAAGGVVTLKASADYETQKDYKIVVTATDNGKGNLSDSQEVKISVRDVDEAPVAGSVAAQTAQQGQAFRFTLPDKAFSDADAGDKLSLSATLANGDALPAWLGFNANNGKFEGTPGNADITATPWTVRVTATDKGGLTAALDFTLAVTNANDAPQAQDDAAQVSERGTVSGNLLANDSDQDQGDSLIVAQVKLDGKTTAIPAAGALTLTLKSGALLTLSGDGSYRFDPNNAYFKLGEGDSATETVPYTVTDSNGLSSTAQLTITIQGQNEAPVIEIDKTVIIDQYTERKGDDAANSAGLSIQRPVDPNQDKLTISVNTLPEHGTVQTEAGTGVAVGDTLSLNTLNTLRFTPEPGFTGAAGKFVYQVDDGHNAPEQQTVVIDVKPVQYLDIALQNATRAEGNAADGTTPFTFTVYRSGDGSTNTTVNWQIDSRSGPGEAGNGDFPNQVLPSGQVSFAPGETSKTLSVTILADGLVEPSETFTVRLTSSQISQSDGSAATVETRSLGDTASGLIVNDDTLPVITSVAEVPTGTGHNHDRYFTGDTLVFEVKFDRAITATGTPSLSLNVGTRTGSGRFQDVTRSATLVSGTGSDTLRFAYTVQSNDVDPNGIQIAGSVKGGTLTDAAGNAAVRDFGSVSERGTKLNSNPGVVIDGYFSGATVFADANRNGAQESDEAYSVTDNAGNYLVLGGDGPYLMLGGTDISTNLPFEGLYEAPPRASVITPLTTLLVGLAGKDATDAQYDATQSVLKTALSIDANVDILNTDPFYEISRTDTSAQDIATALTTQAEAAKMANLLVQGSAVLTGAATRDLAPGAAGLAITQATADYILARPGQSVDLADASVVQAILSAAGQSLAGVDSAKVDGSSAAAADIISAGNRQVDAAVDTGGLEGLTQMVQAQVVAQGDAGDALQQGVQNDDLSQAVTDFTGANLTQAVQAAEVGTVVPVYLDIQPVAADHAEGNGKDPVYTFTVTRSGNTAAAFSVDYTLAGDINAADFGGAPLTGTLSFAAGETQRTLTLNVSGDTVKESDEAFRVTLHDAGIAASYLNDSAEGLIRNDDPKNPVITLPATPSLSAGHPGLIAGIQVDDADSPTLTVALSSDGGRLSLTGPAAQTGNATQLTLSGSVADINATLANLVYTGDAGATAATLRIEAGDNDPGTVDARQTLDIALLTAPSNRLPTNPTVLAGHATEVIGIGVSAAAQGRPITVTLTPDNGTVAVTGYGGVLVEHLSQDRLQISGNLDDVDNTLASLEFTAVTRVTTAGIRVVTDDGNPQTAHADDVLLMGVVFAPENRLHGEHGAGVAGSPVAIAGIKVYDFDSKDLQVTLTVDGGALALNAQGEVTVSQPDGHSYRLYGSQADLNATLATLSFTGNADATVGRVQITTTDLGVITPAATSTYTLDVLHAPGITLPVSPSVVAGNTLAVDGVSVSDIDPDLLTVTLTPQGGRLDAHAAAGATLTRNGEQLILEGSAATVNTTLAELTFTPAADAKNGAIRVQADDNDPRTADAERTLEIGISRQPELSLPDLATIPTALGVDTALPGIALSDTGATLNRVTLSVDSGVLSLIAAGTAGIEQAGEGMLIVTGTAQDLNASLASLHYTGSTAGTASLQIQVDFGDPAWPDVAGRLTIAVFDEPVITSTAPVFHYSDTPDDDAFAAQSYTATAAGFGEGAALTWRIGGTAVGSYGTLTLTGSTFTYTPNDAAIEALHDNAEESFTLTVSDGDTTLSQVLRIALNGANDSPASLSDSYSVLEDGALDVAAGLLGNDSDRDDASLTAILVQGPQHGSLALNPDGSFRYTPQADYHGSDSFTYQANDGTATGNTVEVALSIAPVDDAPQGQTDRYGTLEDQALTIDVTQGVLGNDSDADGDALTAQLIQGPQHGALAFNPDGSFQYTPDADYHGADSFRYQANDGQADGPVITVALTV
ncbi:MAG: tandem-95 repeat protein, partial [Methylococcaceae bacterium]